MSWWPPRLPTVFGWAGLGFGDRLKLMAFLAQAGAGVAMTVLASFAMYRLAEMKAVWPTFYLGAMAMILVGIVITGFAGLLIVRTLEVRGPGGFVFKSQDAGAVTEALKGAETAAAMASPSPSPSPPPEPATSDALAGARRVEDAASGERAAIQEEAGDAGRN